MRSYVVMTTEPRGIEHLLELQEVDSAADRLLSRRDLLESGDSIREARERLGASEAALADLRLELDELSREQQRREGDVDSFDRKIAAEEKRLYDGSVANAKELESIQAEIAGMRGRKSRIEDELLDIMERRESLDASVAEAQRAGAEIAGELDTLLGDSSAELEQIGVELSDLATRRESLVPAFDEELLELYGDLRRQKKGVGVAALLSGVCQGCHQKLSAVELERLRKTDGIRRCDYCRRILVL